MRRLITLALILCSNLAIAQPPSDEPLPQKAQQLMERITPTKHSALEVREKAQRQISRNPFGIAFNQPNYLLPFYYTGNPNSGVLAGNTPNGQPVSSNEFKFQISLKAPVFEHIMHMPLDLYLGYTQLSYWQLYQKLPYFRESNYQPEIFFSYRPHRNWQVNLGVVHESNGRGGELERSWNRAYGQITLSGDNWLFYVKPWLLIFKRQSADLHNPDITRFMGHEELLYAHQLGRASLSLQVRNAERLFSRASFTANFSIPMTKKLQFMVQGFSGYGQSLIEYNHHTNSLGVGIGLSNWF